MNFFARQVSAVLGLLLAALPLAASLAHAQFFIPPVSQIDPKVLSIDEKAVLGHSIDPSTELIDQNGKSFRWGDLAGKPTLVAFSYYTCDGACSLINTTLRDLLRKMTRLQAGRDFNLLTISFDHHDNLETTGAFRRHLELAADLAPNWTFATFRNEADLKAQTEKIGFKFFWSPQDRIFLHPGAFLFFSPKGELARVLYHRDIDAADIELAVLDARNGEFKVGEIVDYAISLCYSYSYHDGKYRVNFPAFIGVGSAALGFMLLALAMLAFRSRRQPNLGSAS